MRDRVILFNDPINFCPHKKKKVSFFFRKRLIYGMMRN